MGNPLQAIEDWIWHKELTSIAKKLVILVVSWNAAHNLSKLGIQINIDQTQATVALFGGLEYLRNYLRKQFKIWWL